MQKQIAQIDLSINPLQVAAKKETVYFDTDFDRSKLEEYAKAEFLRKILEDFQHRLENAIVSEYHAISVEVLKSKPS